MVKYIIWKDNLVDRTAKGLFLMNFKAGGLQEEHEIAILNSGTLSEFI
jgi:hypothetical protein